MPRLMNLFKQMSEVGQCFTLFLIALVCLVILQYNNDYMRYRNVPVTFIEKSAEDSCHKTGCTKAYIGLFKTDGGIFFDRPISYYMYTQMHLREQFELNLRPHDIKQTKGENILYLILPVILMAVTAFLGLITVVVFFHWRSKSK